jgi:hypothetical protein
MRISFALSAVILTFALLGTAGAQDVFVSLVANSPADCVDDGQCDFQSAIPFAASNSQDDTIHVASGIYNVTNLEYDPDPTENNSLTIRGAGAGSTILDGQGTSWILAIWTDRIPDDSAAHVTVEGMTFRNGNDLSIYGEGAGLWIRTAAADVSVRNSVFSANEANRAGGLYVETADGTATVSQCTFQDGNFTNQDGGGAYLLAMGSGSLSVRESYFSGNGTGVGVGGGLYMETGLGGGSITLETSSFEDNTTRQDDGGGAYLFANAGPVTVFRNTFTANIANARIGGGGLYAQAAGVQNVTIAGNTFQANDSNPVSGGGAYVAGRGSIVFANNTLAGNKTLEGGGVYFKLTGTAAADIHNNIVWNNGGSAGADIAIDDGAGTSADVDFNDYGFLSATGGGTVTEGPNNINADPLFVLSSPLASLTPADAFAYAGSGLGTGLLLFGIVSGGRLGKRRFLFLLAALLIASGMLASCGSSSGGSTTRTLIDPATWDLHIRGGSPAIDAGDDPSVPPALTLDRDGEQRIQGGTVDMGSDEF